MATDFEVRVRSMVVDFSVVRLDRFVPLIPRGDDRPSASVRRDRLKLRRRLLADLPWYRAVASGVAEVQLLEAERWLREDVQELGGLAGAW